MNKEAKKSLIKKLSETSKKKLWMILYGQPGVGKTTLAAKLGKKVLFLDLEDGTKSLEHEKDEQARKHIFENVSIINDINNLDKLREAFSEARDFDCDFIVLDSLSPVVNLYVDAVCRDWGIRGLGLDRDGRQDHGKSYREVSVRVMKFINSLYETKKNIVIIGHIKSTTRTTPYCQDYSQATIDVTSGLEKELLKDVNVCAYINLEVIVVDNKPIEKVERVIYASGETVGVLSKNRIGITENKLSSEQFIEKIREYCNA